MLLINIMKRKYKTLDDIIEDYGIPSIVRHLTRDKDMLPSYYARDLGGCFKPVTVSQRIEPVLMRDFVYFNKLVREITTLGTIPAHFSHVLLNLQGGIITDILNLKIDVHTLVMALYISLVFEKMTSMYESFNASENRFYIKGRNYTYFGEELK